MTQGPKKFTLLFTATQLQGAVPRFEPTMETEGSFQKVRNRVAKVPQGTRKPAGNWLGDSPSRVHRHPGPSLPARPLSTMARLTGGKAPLLRGLFRERKHPASYFSAISTKRDKEIPRSVTSNSGHTFPLSLAHSLSCTHMLMTP